MVPTPNNTHERDAGREIPIPAISKPAGGPQRTGAIWSGRWIGMAANIGALIGLLLVVFQLRQNRDLMRAQIRHELSMGIVDLLMEPASNAQLASILLRAEQGDTLQPEEEFQFRLRSNALLRYWEDVHYQYRQGLYDMVEFTQQKRAWAGALQRSIGLVQYWCEVRTLYSPQFAAEIDSLVPKGACTTIGGG